MTKSLVSPWLQQAKTLEFKPGKYIFGVTNEGVPYALGFWLRGEDLALQESCSHARHLTRVTPYARRLSRPSLASRNAM